MIKTDWIQGINRMEKAAQVILAALPVGAMLLQLCLLLEKMTSTGNDKMMRRLSVNWGWLRCRGCQA